MNKEEIMALFNANRLEEAGKALEGMQDSAWALYMLGRIAWKQGRRAEAITRYESAAALDPEGEGATALEQVREIMDFYNKDLYNP